MPADRLDIEVDVQLNDGRVVFGVLEQWDQRDGAWWGWVLVHADGNTGRRGWYPADRLTELVYCTWYAGRVGCLHACERSA